MRIVVDADACPVKPIIVRLAKERGIPVVMVMDSAHEYADGYSRVIIVDKARDSADYRIMGLLRAGDRVVTQDYGLAAMALSKGARALDQNGRAYTDDNIDTLLMERHLGGKIRRSGGRTRGPARRTREDDARFASALLGMLDGPDAEG